MKILVAEPIAAAGLELLRAQAGLGRDRVQPQGIRAIPGRSGSADRAQRRQGHQAGSGTGAQAARHRPRGRRRGQRRSAGGHRGGRSGDEHSRRERRLRGGAHAGAHAGHGPLHPTGQRLHQGRQVGEEEVHGQRAARQDAGRGRPGQHRPGSGPAGARLRNEDRRQRPLRHAAGGRGRDRGAGGSRHACTRRATTSRCTLRLRRKPARCSRPVRSPR